jgi:hypothetical protein
LQINGLPTTIGEPRKDLDSLLENIEADTTVSSSLELILNIAGESWRLLESIATFLQLHPCPWISDCKRTTDHEDPSSPPHLAAYVLQMLALVEDTFVGGWVTWARYATRLFRRIWRTKQTEYKSQNRGSAFAIDSWFLPYCQFCI